MKQLPHSIAESLNVNTSKFTLHLQQLVKNNTTLMLSAGTKQFSQNDSRPSRENALLLEETVRKTLSI